MEKIKFLLNGCDISFVAEAPADMTVKQLIDQASKIEPDYCACGVCRYLGDYKTEILFTYDGVERVDDFAACTIHTDESWLKERYDYH